MIDRLRGRIRAGRAVREGAPAAEERVELIATIPLHGSDAPLWQVQLQLITEPQADGEKLRLRAHFQTNFASALRTALAASRDTPPLSGSGGRALTLSERAGAVVQGGARRVLAIPLLRRLAEPVLRHDFNTWIEVHASTASLDSGSRDLLPQAERLAALGIKPRRTGDDGPMAESWAGEAPGGFAQVSVVQLEKKHLPPRLARMLGEQSFQLAAAVVNTVEEK